MKAVKMRDLGVEELRTKEQDLRRELFNLRFQTATGEVQNPKRSREVRRDIARVLTVLTEKTTKSA